MSWGHRFAKNFDTLAYQGKVPTHLYLGREEWDAFREYIQPMERYSARRSPEDEPVTKYRDVEIIRVFLPSHWRFVYDS